MEIWDLKYQFDIKQTFYEEREQEESEKIQNPKAEIKKKLEICWAVVGRKLEMIASEIQRGSLLIKNTKLQMSVLEGEMRSGTM